MSGQVATDKHRLFMWRGEGVMCAVVMLNPSTATGETPDPTTTKLDQFTKDWMYSAYCVANVYPYRTPYPAALWYPGSGDIRLREQNDAYLRAVATCPLVVCAWGNGALEADARHTVAILREPGRPLFCLGTNQGGQPKHPLYVPYSQKLIEYRQFT